MIPERQLHVGQRVRRVDGVECVIIEVDEPSPSRYRVDTGEWYVCEELTPVRRDDLEHGSHPRITMRGDRVTSIESKP